MTPNSWMVIGTPVGMGMDNWEMTAMTAANIPPRTRSLEEKAGLWAVAPLLRGTA